MTEEELKRESTDQKDVVLFERLIEIHLNYIKPQDFVLSYRFLRVFLTYVIM